MANVLEFQIVGDISNLRSSLTTAEALQNDFTESIERTSNELAESVTATRNYQRAIEDLENEYRQGSVSSREYTQRLDELRRSEQDSVSQTSNLRRELSNLQRSQRDLSNTTNRQLTPATADGGNALMQFSRIAQDAPFGIMGIGNNITATTEAFSQLSRSAGGTGAALRAVASSMLGSGGILLAVSLVTTGLTYMSQNGLTVEDVFNKLTGTLNENADAFKKASVEGAKAASEEIVNLKTLVDVAKNDTLSREKRLIAVEKLQKEYPAYFGNLSKEAILTGNITKQVDDLTKALLAKAVAEKLTESAADVQLRILEANGRYNKSRNETIRLEKELADFRSKNSKDEIYADNNKLIAENKITFALFNSKKAQKEASDEIAAGNKVLNERLAIASKFRGAGILTEQGNAKTTKAKTPKTQKAKKDTFDNQKALDKLSEIAFQMQEVTSQPLFDNEKTEENLNKLIELANEMAFTVKDKFTVAQQAGQIFSDATGSAIGTLTNELTSSLETGSAVLDSFVGSIIQSLAQIASAQLAGLIAQQAIATKEVTTSAGVSTAKGIESATKTAAASGPAAAFVLPALVGAAIGFIAAAFSGIKFAHGGVVPGGSFTGDKIPAMLNSGETVMNRQQQANTLMAIANGNSNSLQGNRIMDNFTLDTVLRGSDLLLAIKREERKR